MKKKKLKIFAALGIFFSFLLFWGILISGSIISSSCGSPCPSSSTTTTGPPTTDPCAPTETDGVCQSTPVKSGWVKIKIYNALNQCGVTTDVTQCNVYNTARVDNLPSGCTLTVVLSPVIPPNWTKQYETKDETACGYAIGSGINNYMVIKRQ